MVEPDRNSNRPLGLVLLVILCFALGILLIILALIALLTDSDLIAWIAPATSYFDRPAQIGMLVFYGLVFILCGFGNWRLNGVAKSVILVLSMIVVVLYPLRLAITVSSLANNSWAFRNKDTAAMIVTLTGIPLAIIILLYISRPKLILAFEAHEMETTKRKIRGLEEKIELGRQRAHAGEIKKAELAKLRHDCIAEERLLRARIRHLEKVRLSRERKIKDKAKKKEETKEEKIAKREERKAHKEEMRAEKEAKREEKEKEEEKEEEKKEAEKEDGKKKVKKKVKKEKSPEKEEDKKEAEKEDGKKKVKKRAKKEKSPEKEDSEEEK